MGLLVASVLLACPACRKRIASSAHTCPVCGELLSDHWEAQGRNWLRWRRNVAWGLLLSAAAIAVIYRAEIGNQVKPSGTTTKPEAVAIGRPPQAEIKQAVNQALAANKQQPSAKLDPPPLPAQPIPQTKQAPGNIVKSGNAILCGSLLDAQIVFQLNQAKQLDKVPPQKGCWAITKGKEVMVLSVVGGYALISPMDDLNEKAWTSASWLNGN